MGLLGAHPPDKTPMEIYFCDLCNESVPDSDIHNGQAFRRKGRVVCIACDQAMGGGGTDSKPGSDGEATTAEFGGGLGTVVGKSGDPLNGVGEPFSGTAAGGASQTTAAGEAMPAGVRGREGGGGVWIGMFAIAFAGLGLWAVIDRVDALAAQQRTAERSTEAGLREAKRVHDVFVAGLPQILNEASATAALEQEALRQPLLNQIAKLDSELAAAIERESVAAGELRGLQARLESQETQLSQQVGGFQQNVARLEEDLVFYKDRVIQLEETLRGLSAGAVGLEGAGQAGNTAVKNWNSLLPDLKHTNAGLRLEAIYSLGETGDSGVVPHLTPMLADEDLFVRMATARMLEDLAARAAVPALINALEDAQGAVREAAVRALRSITGKAFAFNPVGSDGERAKRLEQWRSWWKRSGDDFLTGS